MSKVFTLLHTGSTRHRNGYGHPEGPGRIEALGALLNGQSFPGVIRPELELLRKVEPLLVHSSAYLESLEKRLGEANDLVELDEDTYAGKESLETALEGLSLQEQALQLCQREGAPSFVLSRPPGHHARPGSSMGFCLLANGAYAARYAQKELGLRRIAIVDWDVHQGNGTEEIFLENPSVYTISLHAYPFWPYGYGEAKNRGKGRGQGYNLNLPLPMEAGDWQYIQYFENFVMPSLDQFEPDLIIIAAGFDAHRLERGSRTTEKSSMSLTENGYSYMTERLHRFARKYCQGRLHLTLEGGYNLPSLCSSVKVVLDTLLEERVVNSPGFTTGAEMNVKH